MTSLQAYRDDGPVATLLGRLAQGVFAADPPSGTRPHHLPPLAPALVAAVITAVLLLVGGGSESNWVLFTPVVALLLTGPAASHPHDGPLDWLVPPVIRAIEYGYLAVLGFAHGVPEPLIYVLIAVLAYHHYDTVYRTRQRLWPPDWVFRAGLGWDGRMLLIAAAGLIGALPFAYAALAVYLGVLFGGESVSTWTQTGRRGGEMVDLEGENAA
jgi:hypothetical protein